MIIKRSGDKLCCNDGKGHIFLAGPTPRGDVGKSWRPEALEILKKWNYTGIVSVPEPFCKNYSAQVDWEEKHLEMSTCILFWIPRELETMPGFTTNIEFGEWYKSGKVVLGYPPEAKKMRFLEYKAGKQMITVYSTLENTISWSISKANEVTERATFDKLMREGVPRR